MVKVVNDGLLGLRQVELHALVLNLLFLVGLLAYDLQLRKGNSSVFVQRLNPAKHPHVALQMQNLVLLDLADLFVLNHAHLEVLLQVLHFRDLNLQLLLFLLVLLVLYFHSLIHL